MAKSKKLKIGFILSLIAGIIMTVFGPISIIEGEAYFTIGKAIIGIFVIGGALLFYKKPEKYLASGIIIIVFSLIVLLMHISIPPILGIIGGILVLLKK